ncbi:MAG: oligosaccharide flippase family protein [Methylococcales bacterium]|nr:oligosaccharide flippase family protein [Methylococcales bacterium]
MSALQQLAGQTAIYGFSSIFGRLLNYLLVPLYTYTFSAEQYGVVTEFYAYSGFFAVLLVFGLETGYFRFRHNKPEYQAERVYASALSFIVLLTGVFLALLHGNQAWLATELGYADNPLYLQWFAAILALDALSALPFAKLRADNRALRFAGIKLLEIVLSIGLNLGFLVFWPALLARYPDMALAGWYNPDFGVGYIFIANLIASTIKCLLLLPQLRGVPVCVPDRLLAALLRYSGPMVIIGFAGMVNEMLDRVLLKQYLPYDAATNLKMLGIYGACYKLAMLMSLFVQAFRYAGEPFFFRMAGHRQARTDYARVMTLFVIAGCVIFLGVTLYLPWFQYFIGPEYRAGLTVVPILLMANLLLGVYVNLSLWYKLSDRTLLGAGVSLLGALLTVVLNLAWIPRFGYVGSAWATLLSYGAMVLISWVLGRVFYPVPYPLLRLVFYPILTLGLYRVQPILAAELPFWLSGLALIVVFCVVVLLLERKFRLAKVYA